MCVHVHLVVPNSRYVGPMGVVCMHVLVVLYSAFLPPTHIHVRLLHKCTHTAKEEKEGYDATGGKAYLKSCEALGIIPASYFLRTIQAEENSISMNHHGVGPKGAKAIAVALTVSPSVYVIKLRDIQNSGPSNCLKHRTVITTSYNGYMYRWGYRYYLAVRNN